MCCSQEGLSDPNCTAFFPLKAFRFSCSNFAISCGENNGVFTNALHPAARVENSVGKKRHSLNLLLDVVRGSVTSTCKDIVLSWVPRLLVVKLSERRF